MKMVIDWYLTIKTLHILSSTILFGTGLGIVFFMLQSYFTDNLQEKFYAARYTVLADYLFTLPAVILQPLTGVWLIWYGGYNWMDYWIITSSMIYILTGVCWLPVVWIQIQLKKILEESVTNKTTLPVRYHKLFNIWFWFGWPAFTGLIVIFFLMVMKPV